MVKADKCIKAGKGKSVSEGKKGCPSKSAKNKKIFRQRAPRKEKYSVKKRKNTLSMSVKRIKFVRQRALVKD